MIKHLFFALCCLVIIYLTADYLGIIPATDNTFIPNTNDSGFTVGQDGHNNNDSPEAFDFVVEDHDTNLTGFEEIFNGVFYKKSGTTTIILAELGNPDVRFFVSPDTTPMTVCTQLDRYGLQLAVNGGGFDWSRGAIPFAMSDGKVYSTETTPGLTIAITEDNEVFFAQMNEEIPPNTVYAVSGFNRLIYRGDILSRFYPGDENYKASYGNVARRTKFM